MVPGRIWLMRILAGVTVLVSGGVGTVATMAATGNLSLVDENKVYVCNFYNYDDKIRFTSAISTITTTASSIPATSSQATTRFIVGKPRASQATRPPNTSSPAGTNR